MTVDELINVAVSQITSCFTPEDCKREATLDDAQTMLFTFAVLVQAFEQIQQPATAPDPGVKKR